jgi:hypothetical protein
VITKNWLNGTWKMAQDVKSVGKDKEELVEQHLKNDFSR